MGDVQFLGNTGFRLWNGTGYSMSQATVNYAGSFGAYGDPTQQLFITDLDLVNTIDDDSYVEYVTVENSTRTGAGDDINALDPSNVDDGDNIGWKFAHQLAILDSTYPHSSELLVLSTNSTPDIVEPVHDHTSVDIILGSSVTISIIESEHASTSKLIKLSSHSTLGVDDDTVQHDSDQIDLATDSSLLIEDAQHAHLSDEFGLIVNLVIEDSLYSHTSDNIPLDINTLAIDIGSHGHSSGALELETDTTLSVDSSGHLHSSDIVALLHEYDIVVDSSVHAHVSDELSPELFYVLDTQDSTHDHSSEVLILALFRTLESTHAHSSGEPELSSKVSLAIHASRHGNTSKLISLNTPGAVVPVDVSMHDTSNIIGQHVPQLPNYPIKSYVSYRRVEGRLIALSIGSGFETGSHFGTQHMIQQDGGSVTYFYHSMIAPNTVGPVLFRPTHSGPRVIKREQQQYDLPDVEAPEEKKDDGLPPVTTQKRKRRGGMRRQR